MEDGQSLKPTLRAKHAMVTRSEKVQMPFIRLHLFRQRISYHAIYLPFSAHVITLHGLTFIAIYGGEGCLKTGIKAYTKHDCNYTLSLVSGISNENFSKTRSGICSASVSVNLVKFQGKQ